MSVQINGVVGFLQIPFLSAVQQENLHKEIFDALYKDSGPLFDKLVRYRTKITFIDYTFSKSALDGGGLNWKFKITGRMEGPAAYLNFTCTGLSLGEGGKIGIQEIEVTPFKLVNQNKSLVANEFNGINVWEKVGQYVHGDGDVSVIHLSDQEI